MRPFLQPTLLWLGASIARGLGINDVINVESHVSENGCQQATTSERCCGYVGRKEWVVGGRGRVATGPSESDVQYPVGTASKRNA